MADLTFGLDELKMLAVLRAATDPEQTKVLFNQIDAKLDAAQKRLFEMEEQNQSRIREAEETLRAAAQLKYETDERLRGFEERESAMRQVGDALTLEKQNFAKVRRAVESGQNEREERLNAFAASLEERERRLTLKEAGAQQHSDAAEARYKKMMAAALLFDQIKVALA